MKIFKDYTDEFETLKTKISMVDSNAIDNGKELQEVRKEIETINKSIHNLTLDFTDLKNILLDMKLAAIKAETEPVKEEEEEVGDEEYCYGGLKISKTYYKPYRYTEMDKELYNFKYSSRRNRIVHSSFNIFDVLMIMGIESEYGSSWETWTDLQNMFGIGPNIFKKLVYNIKTGFFNKFITDIPITFSKEYGLLYVNGKKTKVPIKTAKYIVECVTNSNHQVSTILKFEKAGECSKLMTRIIGTQYKNDELLSLFADSGKVVENNPQKRRELGI